MNVTIEPYVIASKPDAYKAYKLYREPIKAIKVVPLNSLPPRPADFKITIIAALM